MSKKNARLLKWMMAVLLAFLLTGIIICITSPAHKIQGKYYVIGAHKVIHAPVVTVYQYLSNSANAAKWSSYIHHITLLQGVDGAVHCKRRCFKNANEKGIQWDEEILFIDSLKTRRLSIYNAKGFPVYIEGLLTEQHYIGMGDFTDLSLVLILNAEHTLWDKIKFYAGAYQVKSIFKANLKNIKDRIEQP